MGAPKYRQFGAEKAANDMKGQAIKKALCLSQIGEL